jgi:hypothetical protein
MNASIKMQQQRKMRGWQEIFIYRHQPPSRCVHQRLVVSDSYRLKPPDAPRTKTPLLVLLLLQRSHTSVTSSTLVICTDRLHATPPAAFASQWDLRAHAAPRCGRPVLQLQLPLILTWALGSRAAALEAARAGRCRRSRPSPSTYDTTGS